MSSNLKTEPEMGMIMLCSMREESKLGQARKPEHMGYTTIGNGVGNGYTKHPLSSHSMDNATELRGLCSVFYWPMKKIPLKGWLEPLRSSRTTWAFQAPLGLNQPSFSKHGKLEMCILWVALISM